MSAPSDTLDRLDARHDELIRKLDELNAQIEQALAEFAKSRESDSPRFTSAGRATPTC